MAGPLLEAFEVSEQCRLERSISVHSEKVLARWRRLVRALMLKQRLKQTYGQSGGTSTNAPDTPKLADLVQSTRPKE